MITRGNMVASVKRDEILGGGVISTTPFAKYKTLLLLNSFSTDSIFSVKGGE